MNTLNSYDPVMEMMGQEPQGHFLHSHTHNSIYFQARCIKQEARGLQVVGFSPTAVLLQNILAFSFQMKPWSMVLSGQRSRGPFREMNKKATKLSTFWINIHDHLRRRIPVGPPSSEKLRLPSCTINLGRKAVTVGCLQFISIINSDGI